MTSELDELEISIEQAKAMISKADALKRLESNADFKLVVSEGYFKEEAERLTSILGDPNLKDVQESVLHDLHSLGSLKRYFLTVYQLGQVMSNQLERDLSTKHEIMLESEEE